MNGPSTHLSGHVLSGRYVLQERIGSGGAGVVWRAHDSVLDRLVAVKLPSGGVYTDTEASSRFRKEATAAASLTHPHAVMVFDIGADEGRDYLVMELVEGGTLERLLETGPLPTGVVASLGSQLGRALGAAHAIGLVHRDVKPSNVLVTVDGVPKLSDYGIARALGEATTRLTAPGSLMGTARYIAPEQLREQDVDGRADVYSLGLVLHQAITGLAPFGEGTAIEIAMRRLFVELPRASESQPDIAPELDEVLVKATQLDPDDRFADGHELAAALGPLAAPEAGRVLAARNAQHRTEAMDTGPLRTQPVAGHVASDGTQVLESDTASQDTRTLDVDAVSPDAPAHPTADAPAADAPGGRGTAETDRRAPSGASRFDARRLLPWAAAAAVAVIGSVVLVLGGSEDDEAGAADPATDEIVVVDGGDHDPFGSGEEHAAHVPSAFDGDPSTYWRTQQYRTDPELGGLKPGVGIWLDLGEAHDVGAVIVHTTNPGASFTLYAGDAPPGGGQAPDEWGTAVARVESAGQEERIELDEPATARVWLLWFTELPDEGGRFRATVSDVRFLPD